MEKKNLGMLAMTLMLLGVIFAPTALAAAAGNMNTLCEEISDDLNVAGGCVDDDGLEDAATSSAALVVLEGGDKSSIIILAVVAIIVVGAGVAVIAGGTSGIKKLMGIGK